ncbi:MAG: hypothetical protein IKQ82_00075, partial [Lentisphaeria bacterium]|nr:hypothetical protein [Lentisphaeria bacterium]
MESLLRIMPSEVMPLEMMYAIGAAFQFIMNRFCVSSITIMLFQEEIKQFFSFFLWFSHCEGGSRTLCVHGRRRPALRLCAATLAHSQSEPILC